MNGVTGTNDIEGKVARVSDKRGGNRTSFNRASGAGEMAGAAAMVALSELAKRAKTKEWSPFSA
jgi:hypothetical protein